MINIYADETCTHPSHGKYLMISAITLEQEIAKEIRKKINSLKANLPQSEFHFTKLTKNTVHQYQQLIDLFFEYYNQKESYKRGISQPRAYRKITFDALFVEHQKIDNITFNDGDAKLGFLRFYKTLLEFLVRKYYLQEQQFYIVPDDINLKKGLLTVNEHEIQLEGFDSVKHLINQDFELNNGIPNVIHRIQKQQSHAEPLLQLTDVILGLLKCKFNDSNLTGSKREKARREVLSYFEQRCEEARIKLDLGNGYPYRSFNLWEFNSAEF
jgi:hypothetical protein